MCIQEIRGCQCMVRGVRVSLVNIGKTDPRRYMFGLLRRMSGDEAWGEESFTSRSGNLSDLVPQNVLLVGTQLLVRHRDDCEDRKEQCVFSNDHCNRLPRDLQSRCCSYPVEDVICFSSLLCSQLLYSSRCSWLITACFMSIIISPGSSVTITGCPLPVANAGHTCSAGILR